MSYTPKNNFNLQLIETDVDVPVYTPENNSNLQLGRTGIGKKGFRKKLLADVACCDNLKGYEYYGGFPLETSLEFSRDMAVHGGCPNFSWEVVDSVYFTFAHATTAGRTNTVNADPTVPIDAEELAIVEDNCGHQLVFLILYCGGGISITPLSPISPDPPDDPPYDPPWPPRLPSGLISGCNCDDIEIGYATQTMNICETQELGVTGGLLRCAYEYRWDIISGGGSLSSHYGQIVVYTAPISNENCDANAVISLSVAGEVCDTLGIAINEYTGTAGRQFDHCSERTPTSTNCLVLSFSCDGSTPGAPHILHWFWNVDGNCAELCEGVLPKDDRTEEMIIGGCCPHQLL